MTSNESAGPAVELLYFEGCPNHEALLPHLHELLAECGVTSPISLIEVVSQEEAERMEFFGSPTLRIDGADVDSSAIGRTDYGLQCRLYTTDHGTQGTPTNQMIYRALGVSHS